MEELYTWYQKNVQLIYDVIEHTAMRLCQASSYICHKNNLMTSIGIKVVRFLYFPINTNKRHFMRKVRIKTLLRIVLMYKCKIKQAENVNVLLYSQTSIAWKLWGLFFTSQNHPKCELNSHFWWFWLVKIAPITRIWVQRDSKT